MFMIFPPVNHILNLDACHIFNSLCSEEINRWGALQPKGFCAEIRLVTVFCVHGRMIASGCLGVSEMYYLHTCTPT